MRGRMWSVDGCTAKFDRVFVNATLPFEGSGKAISPLRAIPAYHGAGFVITIVQPYDGEDTPDNCRCLMRPVSADDFRTLGGATASVAS